MSKGFWTDLGDHARNRLLSPASVPRPVLGPAASIRSVVGGRWPGFLDVGVHSLGKPLAVLSQQVCRGAGGQCQSGSVPGHLLQGRASYHAWVALASPIPPTPNPLARGHLPRSNPHLGFFFQATSKASRQLAVSATRALRRLSVLGCSLWAGMWGVSLHATHRLAMARPALSGRVKGPPSRRTGPALRGCSSHLLAGHRAPCPSHVPGSACLLSSPPHCQGNQPQEGAGVFSGVSMSRKKAEGEGQGQR